MTSHNKRTVKLSLVHSTPTRRKNKWDTLNVTETREDSYGRDGCYLPFCKRQDKCHDPAADRHKQDVTKKSVNKNRGDKQVLCAETELFL
jgi:hypothetical protein